MVDLKGLTELETKHVSELTNHDGWKALVKLFFNLSKEDERHILGELSAAVLSNDLQVVAACKDKLVYEAGKRDGMNVIFSLPRAAENNIKKLLEIKKKTPVK